MMVLGFLLLIFAVAFIVVGYMIRKESENAQ